MKIISGDFNVNVWRENIFKPTIGDESLHQERNDISVRIMNFVTSTNMIETFIRNLDRWEDSQAD